MLSCFFISNTRLKLAKNKLKAKQQLVLFENYSISSSMLSYKTNIRYSKKRTKTKAPVLMRLHNYNENGAENEKYIT